MLRMIILTIRTDKPEAEIGLYKGSLPLAYHTWEAHRKLADTIHTKIKSLLNEQGYAVDDLGAILCFAGPGSFTGLRIGASVANALATSLNVPIVGASNADWLEDGLRRLAAGENQIRVVPDYGEPPKTTSPRK